jgi:hypothetical protein
MWRQVGERPGPKVAIEGRDFAVDLVKAGDVDEHVIGFEL